MPWINSCTSSITVSLSIDAKSSLSIESNAKFVTLIIVDHCFVLILARDENDLSHRLYQHQM